MSIPRAWTWHSGLHSHPQAARGLPTAAHASGRRPADGRSGATGGGRLAVAAAAIALTLFIGLPVALYSSSAGPWGSGPSGLVASTPADLPAAAASAGLLSGIQGISSRRMALQRGGGSSGGDASEGAAAAQLWPVLAQPPLQPLLAANPQQPRVEFRDAGHVVGLVDALNSSRWNEPSLYHAHPLPADVAASLALSGAARGSRQHALAAQQPAFPAHCPQGEIRLFVGIASRCCTPEAQAKRDAIRRTWVQQAKEQAPEITVRFIIGQPSTEPELKAAAALLAGEISRHADIVIVPGVDVYRNLPSKTLQLLRYSLSSGCGFTHLMKTDDDVAWRPQLLLDVIRTGQYNFSVDVQYDASGAFDGQPAPSFQGPWMLGMYVGQLDGRKEGGVYPGWKPDRNPRSKWYLSEADLPDELAPLGVRWISGWGYMLSRDLAEFILESAVTIAALPEKRPLWWGRMPWEDGMVGAMLKGVSRVYHHDGFKAAWQECDARTVVKHLDNDAPSLQEGLFVQEKSGLWSKKSIVCSSGVFELGSHSDWRLWRNSLPDNQLNGFM